MEISIAATLTEVDSMWQFLANIGFKFEDTVTASGSQPMPTKTYVDANRNFVCQINIRVHETFDQGYMYHVFVNSHSVDTVTHSVVADGNTHQINFLNGDNMRTYIQFTDAVLARAGITGI
jgi:hypothetical protein